MAVLVAVARGQRVGLPMAGDGRSGSSGTGRAGGTSLQVRRARARAGGLRWAAGLAAGPRSGPGWERGAAPPALGAGRAERGPDVSAGGFVRPQPGPQPGSARAEAAAKLAASSGTPERAPRGAETGKASGGMGREGSGLPGSRRRRSASQKRTITAGGAFAVLVITHCADKETEARGAAPRTPVFEQPCPDPQSRNLLFTRGLRGAT